MLQALFSSEARIKLLKILLLERDGRFYLRELASKAGVPVGNARRELMKLTDAGIVSSEKQGHQVYYRINDHCPIIPELRAIFVKTVGVADVLRVALSRLSDRVATAFVYGSFAKGAQTNESDVDLMVVGNVTFGEVVSSLHEVQNDLSREVNPTVYPVDEFAKKARDKQHFISTVLREPKIFVVGDADELGKLVELEMGN